MITKERKTKSNYFVGSRSVREVKSQNAKTRSRYSGNKLMMFFAENTTGNFARLRPILARENEDYQVTLITEIQRGTWIHPRRSHPMKKEA